MALAVSLICLKSTDNNKYLRYRHEDIRSRGLLKFDADSPMEPYAQFEVEKSKTYDGLVHLKCRYTNKYLVRWSPIHYWITASAYAPDENKSSWTCTLFKPIPTATDEEGSWTKIRLLHVQLGHYAMLAKDDDDSYNLGMFAASNVAGQWSDVFSLTNWDSMFKLPKYVAFKGDNGKYLGAQMIDRQPGLRFSFDDPHDPKVRQEISTYPDGTICIKSIFFGKFWRMISGPRNWVAADADDPRAMGEQPNVSAIFRPSVVHNADSTIALLCMQNALFCKRLTADNRDSFLSTSTTSIDKWASLHFIALDQP